MASKVVSFLVTTQCPKCLKELPAKAEAATCTCGNVTIRFNPADGFTYVLWRETEPTVGTSTVIEPI